MTDTVEAIDPDQVLAGNFGAFETLLIIGWDKEGQFGIRSSSSNAYEILWLLEEAKLSIMRPVEVDDEEEDE